MRSRDDVHGAVIYRISHKQLLTDINKINILYYDEGIDHLRMPAAYYTEVLRIWLTFCRRYFQNDFFEQEILIWL